MTSRPAGKLVQISASTVIGDEVRNPEGECLGKLHEIIIDAATGRVSYAVLSLTGAIGPVKRLFTLPWQALEVSPSEHKFILDVPRERLENAPWFERNHWPDFSDLAWGVGIHSYYGFTPYWSRDSGGMNQLNESVL